MGRVNARLPIVGGLRIAVAAVSLLPCACSASFGVNPTPGTPSQAFAPWESIPNAVAPQRSNARLEVQLSIPSEHRRSDHASPATRSMVIDEGQTKVGSFDTSPGVKGCKRGAGRATICTFTMAVIAGTHKIFTVKTYSAQHGRGHPNAQASVTQTIVANKLNKLKLTLDDVVASIEISLENSEPFTARPSLYPSPCRLKTHPVPRSLVRASTSRGSR